MRHMNLSESENQMSEKKESNAPAIKKKLSKGALALIGAVCAIALITGGLFAYSAAYDRVYPHMSAGGIDVGGLTREDVRRRLDIEYENAGVDRAVTFVCGGNSEQVLLSDLDARLDSTEIAEVAYTIGREGGFFGRGTAMLTSLFKKTEVPLSAKADKDALEELIGKIAGEFEIPMTETTYETQENTLTIIKGNPGKMVDRETVLKLIAEALVNPEIDKIELKVERAEPKTVDLDAFYKELTQPVTDAEYALKDGEVIIIHPKGGITVEKSELKKALESGEKRYTLTVKTAQPKVTVKELEELLFRDVLASYSSDFSTSTAARASNVALTAKRVDGYILMPGDVFSYDETVGRRTVANGYKEAGVYIGNKVESGIGGGICQTSSTLYCAALYANLEIVQRASHSLPVAYVPAGMDATIAEGYIDLKIKNNTEYPIKIQAVTSGRQLTCKFLGVKEPDVKVEIVNTRTATFEPETEISENPALPIGYKKIINEGKQGYSIASKRIVKSGGKVIREEKLTGSVYRASNTEAEVNPADKEKPLDELKVYIEEEYKAEQERLKAEAEMTEATEVKGEPETNAEEKTNGVVTEPGIETGEISE